MKKRLTKLFIPHRHNDFKPLLLEEAALTLIAVIAIGAFVFSGVHTTVLQRSADFLAAVVPNVLVDLANEDRSDNGVGTVVVNDLLVQAAQLKADHMAENEYFAHNSPDGLTPWHWMIEAGYAFTAAGENLAVNFSDSEDVEEAWMNSPGHRANLLNNTFTEIGIATAEGRYQGRDTIYVVQMFGTPAGAPLAVPQDVPETPETPPEPAPIEIPEQTPEPVETPSPTPIEIPELTPEPIVEDEPAVVEIADASAEVEGSFDDLEVIVEDDLFIAVVDPNASATEVVAAEVVDDVLTLESRATFWERLMSQPRTVLSMVYLVLGALIIFAIIMRVVIEFERHHMKHIIYGLLVLAFILALFYISGEYLFSGLLIV